MKDDLLEKINLVQPVILKNTELKIKPKSAIANATRYPRIQITESDILASTCKKQSKNFITSELKKCHVNRPKLND